MFSELTNIFVIELLLSKKFSPTDVKYFGNTNVVTLEESKAAPSIDVTLYAVLFMVNVSGIVNVPDTLPTYSTMFTSKVSSFFE